MPKEGRGSLHSFSEAPRIVTQKIKCLAVNMENTPIAHFSSLFLQPYLMLNIKLLMIKVN